MTRTAPQAAAAGTSPQPATWMAVLILLSGLGLAALIVLQVLEWIHYGSPPSVWPPG